MGFSMDLRKIVLKHSVIRYLNYADLDDDVYGLILDKNLELVLAENKRLKEEIMQLKIEGIVEQQPTIDLEINGKQTALTKEEFIQLVAKYKEKDLKESEPRTIDSNVFIPQDIFAITTHPYYINQFYCHYENEYGAMRSLITSNGFEKYHLFFDLFDLTIADFNEKTDTFRLYNSTSEWIMVSTKTTLTNEFLSNFSKGKEFIRKV